MMVRGSYEVLLRANHVLFQISSKCFLFGKTLHQYMCCDKHLASSATPICRWHSPVMSMRCDAMRRDAMRHRHRHRPLMCSYMIVALTLPKLTCVQKLPNNLGISTLSRLASIKSILNAGFKLLISLSYKAERTTPFAHAWTQKLRDSFC